jgi:hypothetical protein
MREFCVKTQNLQVVWRVLFLSSYILVGGNTKSNTVVITAMLLARFWKQTRNAPQCAAAISFPTWNSVLISLYFFQSRALPPLSLSLSFAVPCVATTFLAQNQSSRHKMLTEEVGGMGIHMRFWMLLIQQLLRAYMILCWRMIPKSAQQPMLAHAAHHTIGCHKRLLILIVSSTVVTPTSSCSGYCEQLAADLRNGS